jgi:hypothetical protein
MLWPYSGVYVNIISPILICISVWLASFIIGRGFFPCISKKASFLASVCGLMILWALFFVTAIPVIIFQSDTVGMNVITLVYGVLVSLTVLVSLGMLIKRIAKKEDKLIPPPFVLDIHEILYLALFLGIVAFQLYKAVFFAYADGDDAYYVAISQSVSGKGDFNSLYTNDPYTGFYIGTAYRYALAPFPIWIAFFARVFSVNAATVAHVCMPVILIPITYVIYNAIAVKLFTDNRTKRYMFLCLISVFVMFSRYSLYSAEVFLLTRTRQGKEALANIIVPFLIYIFLDIAKEEEYKISVKNYIMIILIALSAALTSVFGNLLVLIALFANFVYSFLKHAPLKEKIKAASLAIPGVIMLLLFVVL